MKVKIFETIILFYLGLILVLIFCKTNWVIPNPAFCIVVAAYSFVLFAVTYRLILKEIKKDYENEPYFKKWSAIIFGPIILPVFIWVLTLKPFAYVLGKTAVKHYSEIVTIKSREGGGRRICKYGFILKEYPFPFYTPLCVERKFWLNGNSDSEIMLIGRKNILAFYIDSMKFVGKTIKE